MPERWTPFPDEKWKMIPNTQTSKGAYAITDRGRVVRLWKDGAPRHVLKAMGLVGKLPVVCLLQAKPKKKRVRFVAHLVSDAFLPPKPSKEHILAYKDNDRTNCAASNLQWSIRADIKRRAPSNKRRRRKLANDDVSIMRTRRAAGESIKAIHASYPFVTYNTVATYVRGAKRASP